MKLLTKGSPPPPGGARPRGVPLMTQAEHLGLTVALLAALAAVGAGCEGSSLTTVGDESLGLVVVLPGIEGPLSGLAEDVRTGLREAGVKRAIYIHAWGAPVPGAGLLINQMNFVGNRSWEAWRLASTIQTYRNGHPDQPVHVIGHSGGGGIAVFAAEALGETHVDGLVLLSASISGDYKLAPALAHCREGIVNFYNPADQALLGVGTTLAGNVDGGRAPSAGLNGFSVRPAGLYQQQVPSPAGMDPHVAATRPDFVRTRVAPWVLAPDWPPGLAQRSTEPPATADRQMAAAERR